MGATSTGLQILGCELHKNVFGSRARPNPLGPLAIVRGRGKKEGEGKGWNSREGAEEGRKGRWQGGKERGMFNTQIPADSLWSTYNHVNQLNVMQ